MFDHLFIQNVCRGRKSILIVVQIKLPFSQPKIYIYLTLTIIIPESNINSFRIAQYFGIPESQFIVYHRKTSKNRTVKRSYNKK